MPRKGGTSRRSTGRKERQVETRVKKRRERDGEGRLTGIRRVTEISRLREISRAANKASGRKCGWERRGGALDEQLEAAAEDFSIPVEEIKGLHPV